MNRSTRSQSERHDYDPVEPYRDSDDEDASPSHDDLEPTPAKETRFSLIEYCIFLLMGIAMLWAW